MDHVRNVRVFCWIRKWRTAGSSIPSLPGEQFRLLALPYSGKTDKVLRTLETRATSWERKVEQKGPRRFAINGKLTESDGILPEEKGREDDRGLGSRI
jgi:hypothetical protein